MSHRAVTIEAAYSWRQEDQIGSITPGKIASFTVLDDDPYSLPPMKLRDVPIWGTLFEGRRFPLADNPLCGNNAIGKVYRTQRSSYCWRNPHVHPKTIITLDPSVEAATPVSVRYGVGTLDDCAAWGRCRLVDRFAYDTMVPELIESHAHLMAGRYHVTRDTSRCDRAFAPCVHRHVWKALSRRTRAAAGGRWRGC